jgi:hypothetical protein
LRRIRVYDQGRIFFPHFVFDRFAQMVKTEAVNLQALMGFITSTMRGGHRWFIDNPDDDLIGENVLTASPHAPPSA